VSVTQMIDFNGPIRKMIAAVLFPISLLRFYLRKSCDVRHATEPPYFRHCFFGAVKGSRRAIWDRGVLTRGRAGGSRADQTKDSRNTRTLSAVQLERVQRAESGLPALATSAVVLEWYILRNPAKLASLSGAFVSCLRSRMATTIYGATRYIAVSCVFGRFCHTGRAAVGSLTVTPCALLSGHPGIAPLARGEPMKDIRRNITRSPVPPPARQVADGLETTAPLRADWYRLLAWLTMPLLILTMAVRWAAKESS
jgi:hypothetical protein